MLKKNYLKILTVLGARPQFIKASALSRQIRGYPHKDLQEVIVHTGQHFDYNMSDAFFKELNVPTPHYNLDINSLSHGAMTGQMLEGVENILKIEKPDVVVVYGDTNSTLAGALASAKLHIPVAHVEAGLRSKNMYMPEEVNRILTDRLSSFLFCPSMVAMEHLKYEGFPFDCKNSIKQSISFVGDIMFDVVEHFNDVSSTIVDIKQWGVTPKNYTLLTMHRQENTDDVAMLDKFLSEVDTLSQTHDIVMPLHPRSLSIINNNNMEDKLRQVKVIDPVGYMEMHALIMNALIVVTDSGGLQKESFFHKVPCITIRDETEWTETVELGWNILCPIKTSNLIDVWSGIKRPKVIESKPYGEGNAAKIIIDQLVEAL